MAPIDLDGRRLDQAADIDAAVTELNATRWDGHLASIAAVDNPALAEDDPVRASGWSCQSSAGPAHFDHRWLRGPTGREGTGTTSVDLL